MSDHFDVIIVGVGGMGAAACWQLARRRQRVLGLEKYDVPHTLGSSHGLTRILRVAYYEGAGYVPLLLRALQLWREAGEAFGERLFFRTGSIDAGPDAGGTDTDPAGRDLFAGSLASCRIHGLRHEVLNAGETARRFPGYRLPVDHRVLFQPDGGFVLPERAVVAHVVMAQALGAEIRARETVLDWAPITGGGVRVRTARKTYEAGRLVLSPGAWITDLVPDLNGVAVPARQVLGWFQPANPAMFAPDRFPVLNLSVDEGRYYLLPIWGRPGLKIGRYGHLGETGRADELSRDITAADEETLRRCIRRYFPDADGPTMALESCMFTNTPDEHFILDTLPGQEEVVVVSPCSGHGFKFASVIGEIVADLIGTGRSRFDLSMFRFDRF